MTTKAGLGIFAFALLVIAILLAVGAIGVSPPAEMQAESEEIHEAHTDT